MNTKKTKKLFILWLISLLVAWIIAAFYSVVYNLRNGCPPTGILSGYVLTIAAVVVVYFYPLLLVVHRNAKAEKARRILMATRILITFVSLWLILYVIMLVIELARLMG